MSKNSEVIYDITEHFAEIDDMVDIDNFIVLRGNYINYGSNRIELRDTEIYLEYDYISYISDVNWNNRSEEEYGGVSIIKLKQGEKVPLNDKLKNFEFLYFDFISTNSIGTITSLQDGTIDKSGAVLESFAGQDTFIGSIEVCKTNFMNLSSVNRSTIKTDNCSRGVGFNIGSNHLRTVKSPSYRGAVPSTYNICVDLSMKVRLPNCPSNYQKCWKGGAYQPGRCYINTKQGDRTITTDCNGNNCMRPDGKINKNINYWLVGNGRVDCQGPTNMKEKKDGVEDVDDLSSNRFIDLDGEERRTRNLRNKIFKMQEKVEKQKLDMVSNEKQMKDTQLWIDYNKSLIKMKMNLLDNRNRQMELSMDRNIYWKKVLYVLFALVIAVVMICLFLTSFIKNQN